MVCSWGKDLTGGGLVVVLSLKEHGLMGQASEIISDSFTVELFAGRSCWARPPAPEPDIDP